MTTDYGSSTTSDSDSLGGLGSSTSSDYGSTGSSGSSDSFMDSLWADCNSDYSSIGSSSPGTGSSGSASPTGSTGEGGFDLDAMLRDAGVEKYAGGPQDILGDLFKDLPQTQAPKLGAAVDPQLQGTVDQIAQDPVGGRLVQAANDQGLRSIEVQPLDDGIMGLYLPDQNRILISPETANGNDVVRTLSHELLHAATPAAGDSQNEESLADRIGTEIQQRLTGLGAGYTLNTAGYANLPVDNDIVQTLRNIGIVV